MISIILAAGKGTRLQPITYNIPKPLLEIDGKSLLEHALDALPDSDKIIIVKNYLGDKIIEAIGDNYKGKPIIYVTQDEKAYGTMGAVLAAKEHINDNFLAICSDNFYNKADLERLVELPDSYLVKKVSREQKDQMYPKAKSGIFKLNGEGDDNIYLDAGAWYLSREFIDHPPAKIENNKEIGIPHTMRQIKENESRQYRPVFAETWYPAGTFEELDILKELLGKKINY